MSSNRHACYFRPSHQRLWTRCLQKPSVTPLSVATFVLWKAPSESYIVLLSKKEYEDHWSDGSQSKTSVLLKIMLVCAIGVPFYTGLDQPQLRCVCARWIQAAESWLAAPHAKSRLNMAGIQIQILVLLAKQVCNVEGDHVWISAGSLLRTAMYLRLHRDPAHFAKIKPFHAEMRRRLWTTVVELTV